MAYNGQVGYCGERIKRGKGVSEMVTRKKDAAMAGAGDLLSELLGRSLEVMRDLSMATGAASADASIAGAKRLVKFQRSSVKAGLGLVVKVQKYTEKSLHAAAKEGKWLPQEGKEVVEDWSNMMTSGVEEFTRVTEKSFDSLLTYLDRIEKERKPKVAKKTSSASSSSASKGNAEKKAPAKRKAVPKKNASQSGKS